MKHIGAEIKHFNNLIERKVCNLKTIAMLNEISSSNGYILCYLEGNEGKSVTQKDIEKRFCITRSTASAVLSLMEKKDLITRMISEKDNRVKYISITEKGKEINMNIRRELECFDKKLIEGISKEELKQFIHIIDKMKNNLKEEK